GCCYWQESGIKYADLFWACVAPGCQHRSIGRTLLHYAEQRAKTEGQQIMRINVANLVIPALPLYKSYGFRWLYIHEYLPGTYYTICFIKPLPNNSYPEWKRLLSLVISKLRFIIMYHSDSTPTFINRKLLKKNNQATA
ncbi:MAG: GNAT family N-acetyltransferase, partial [Clostridiales bacterium]|nr:GNAT family N-acetyltransferase [Clostridiales bacterium]